MGTYLILIGFQMKFIFKIHHPRSRFGSGIYWSTILNTDFLPWAISHSYSWSKNCGRSASLFNVFLSEYPVSVSKYASYWNKAGRLNS